jgi:hypothetical protein
MLAISQLPSLKVIFQYLPLYSKLLKPDISAPSYTKAELALMDRERHVKANVFLSMGAFLCYMVVEDSSKHRREFNVHTLTRVNRLCYKRTFSQASLINANISSVGTDK